MILFACLAIIPWRCATELGAEEMTILFSKINA
jgi:hypothetical protein